MRASSWLSTDDAAEAIGGVSRPTLYKLVNTGQLTAFKVGRVLRFRREDIADFLERNRVQPGQLEHLMPHSTERRF